MIIGISQTAKYCNAYFIGKGTKSYGYGWLNNGMIHDYKKGMNNFKEYGNKKQFCKGDIITLHLDLDARTLSFSKNDKFIGIAYKNIAKVSYRIAVCLYLVDGDKTIMSVQMISYKKII